MGIYIKARVSGPTYDADAQAFITAAGITDNTQKTAINTLVDNLKGYNIWTKMRAIYPFVGGTASSHKWNLKNPLDTNAAFRLTFGGGWTHSSTGAKPNGTNGYALTYLVPSSHLINNNTSLSYYSRTQILESSQECGCQNSTGTNVFGLWFYYNPTSNKAYSDGSYPTNAAVINNTNTKGFQIGSRTSSTVLKLFFNNSLLVTNTNTKSLSLVPESFIIGATSQNSGAIQLAYSSKECAFASIGDGLTDTEAANFYTAVQNFNTTLTRNV
jgi:hypothetical protein